jgi:hypothetical protein
VVGYDSKGVAKERRIEKRRARRGREYIPNIEVADIVRLIRIFKHLQHERILKSVASRKGFYIAPSFDRRIRIKAKEG